MDTETERNTNGLEEKMLYLQLLQEPIGRMSSTSGIFKGFSAAILAGLASATVADIEGWVLILGLLPIFSFLALDVYYLRMERLFRLKFDLVAKGRLPMDFNFGFKDIPAKDKKEAKTSRRRCLFSKSILIFYLPVILCGAAICFLKFMNF